MAVPLYGIVSNKAHYSYRTGWTAQIVYCVAAQNVAALISSNYLSVYANSAGSTNMVCVAFDDEPWMEKDVLAAVTGYSNSRRVTFHYAIDYLNVPWPTGITQPSYRSGTTLKLRVRYGGTYQPVAPQGIVPSAGPVPGPNTQLAQYIALNEYHVEWDRVETAPNFTGFVGAVNSDSFLGWAAGQILCAGAEQVPSFVLDPSTPLAWKTIAVFKQRAIVVAAGPNAGTYGWNSWFNPKTQKWEAFTLANGQPMYNPVAMSGMFA